MLFTTNDSYERKMLEDGFVKSLDKNKGQIVWSRQFCPTDAPFSYSENRYDALSSFTAQSSASSTEAESNSFNNREEIAVSRPVSPMSNTYEKACNQCPPSPRGAGVQCSQQIRFPRQQEMYRLTLTPRMNGTELDQNLEHRVGLPVSSLSPTDPLIKNARPLLLIETSSISPDSLESHYLNNGVPMAASRPVLFLGNSHEGEAQGRPLSPRGLRGVYGFKENSRAGTRELAPMQRDVAGNNLRLFSGPGRQVSEPVSLPSPVDHLSTENAVPVAGRQVSFSPLSSNSFSSFNSFNSSISSNKLERNDFTVDRMNVGQVLDNAAGNDRSFFAEPRGRVSSPVPSPLPIDRPTKNAVLSVARQASLSLNTPRLNAQELVCNQLTESPRKQETPKSKTNQSPNNNPNKLTQLASQASGPLDSQRGVPTVVRQDSVSILPNKPASNDFNNSEPVALRSCSPNLNIHEMAGKQSSQLPRKQKLCKSKKSSKKNMNKIAQLELQTAESSVVREVPSSRTSPISPEDAHSQLAAYRAKQKLCYEFHQAQQQLNQSEQRVNLLRQAMMLTGSTRNSLQSSRPDSLQSRCYTAVSSGGNDVAQRWPLVGPSWGY